MDFIENMSTLLDNTSITENGAAGYKSSGDDLTDFFFKISSYRSALDSAILDDFKTIENNPYVLKFLFYLRDCRNGLGERNIFRVCFRTFLSDLKVTEDYSKNVSHFFDLILKYGRGEDIFYCIDFDNKQLTSVLRSYLLDMINIDKSNLANDKPVSIIYKWYPSENTSSAFVKDLAKKVRLLLGMSSKDYRKMLSAFRRKLNVTETYMCSNRWGEINYNYVPSKANLLYSRAFSKHDYERRSKYLSDLAAGKKGVKINSSVNYPYEIYHKYCPRFEYPVYDITYEELWKNLKTVPGLDNTLVVCDGSGSMTCTIGNTDIEALDVSRSLAIFCSQYCKASYKDTFITFSSHPELVKLDSAKTLCDKISIIKKYDDYTRTNLEAVFDLILDVAVTNKLKQEDLPKQLLIISDMEFDEGMNYTRNPVKSAEAKFKTVGLKLPRLVFWNVNSRTKTIPITKNDLGFLLISGFSQNVINMVMNGTDDTKAALLKELDKYVDVPLLN